jgi:dTDP-4-dehydrorhamnose reductase
LNENIKVKRIIPAKSTEFNSAARRPKHSVLQLAKFENNMKLFTPGWLETLKMALS